LMWVPDVWQPTRIVPVVSDARGACHELPAAGAQLNVCRPAYRPQPIFNHRPAHQAQEVQDSPDDGESRKPLHGWPLTAVPRGPKPVAVSWGSQVKFTFRCLGARAPRPP